MKRRTSIFWLMGIAITSAIAATAIHVHFDADLRAAQTRVSTGSHIAQTPCGPIEYGQAGAGPPVLMIHGAGGGFDQTLTIAGPLIRAGFTVIAPSRFGYLRTPLPHDASPTAQAEAHACLLDVLGIEQAAVIGGSAGAPSALQLCLHHPLRCSKLILVVPAIFLSDGREPAPKPSPMAQWVIDATLQSDLAFWAASHLSADTMIESILATPIADYDHASLPEQERVRATLREILPIGARSQGLFADAAVTTVPTHYEFERIVTPTLIITSQNDRFGTLAGSRIAASRIPHARLIVYPSGGHLWVGHQGELWGAIREFLKGNAVRAQWQGELRNPASAPR